MKTSIPIPVQVLHRLKSTIRLKHLDQKAENRLYQNLIELWFTIKVCHSAEKSKLEDSFRNRPYQSLENIYTNIHRDKLTPYQLHVSGKKYNYSDLIAMLIEADTIEVNNHYSAGHFSKSYRPHSSISSAEISMIIVDLHRFVNFMSIGCTRESALDEYPHLADHINAVWSTTIDLEDAFKRIADAQMSAADAYDYQLRALKIALGIHFFTEASTGRLYTSIANFPKLLLPCLRLNGQSLIEIDVCNSQPLLLTAFVDCPTYAADVQDGMFYDRLADALGRTRDYAKRISFSKIFFNNAYVCGAVAIALDSIYPGLLTQINELKFSSPQNAAIEFANGQYNFLWFKLQSLEADIVITAAENMYGTPFLTRHDSILIPRPTGGDNDAPFPHAVVLALEKEFSIHGLKPSLRITDLAKHNTLTQIT